MTRTRFRLVPVLAVLALTGCAQLIGGVLDGAANAAGNRIGQSIVNSNAPPASGPSTGGGTVRTGGGGLGMMYNPLTAGFYTQFLFTIAFGAGGYDVSNVPYKPGEYSVWTMQEGTEASGTIERAFLAEDTKGQQWWRVRFTDTDGKEATMLEGLFTKDMSRLVRLRGQFPGETEGKEMPVDEQSYYMAPRKLSQESIQGATKGTESVTVPAGTFQARHVVFGGPEGTSEWWIADGVPGGLVKQAGGNNDGKALVLQKFGKDAKTALKSF